MEKTNLAIFASGTGTNAFKIIQHFRTNPLVDVKLIVCNRPQAPVLERARAEGIPALLIDRKVFYESTALLERLQAENIGFIALAGFLWLVPPYLVEAYRGRMVNIHPALLPKFGGKGMYGMHVHRAVKAAGETETGITIHWVNEHYDAGDIIFQARCPVEPEDSPETIARKVQQLEHRHYPEVIEQLIQSRLEREKGASQKSSQPFSPKP